MICSWLVAEGSDCKYSTDSCRLNDFFRILNGSTLKLVCFCILHDCIITAVILKLAWVSYSVFFLLVMQNVILSLSPSYASDPTWMNSEMIWAIDLGGFYFLLP